MISGLFRGVFWSVKIFLLQEESMHKSATRCQNSWSMSNLPDATDSGGKKKRGARVEQIWAQLEIPYPSLKCQVDKILYAMFFLDWVKWTKIQKIHAKKKYPQKTNAISSNDCFGGENTFSKFQMIWKFSQLLREKTCGMHQWSHMDVSQTSKWRTSKIWKPPAIHDLSACDWLSLFFWNKPPFAEGERWHVFIDWE